MLVYKGTHIQNFKVLDINSRYGFKALFFATKKELARLYAANEAYLNFTEGFVYEFEIMGKVSEVEFIGNTYCSEYKELIINLFEKGEKAVLIKSVFDYPSSKFIRANYSDILVLFDFSFIKSFKKIEKNVLDINVFTKC